MINKTKYWTACAICVCTVALAMTTFQACNSTQATVSNAANPKAMVTQDNARFTVLTPQMIRVEYSDSAKFEDRPTFVAINRNMPVPEYTSEVQDSVLIIRTKALELRYKLGSDPRDSIHAAENLSITMSLNGTDVKWYPGLQDSLNLKGTCRTLDLCNGDSHRKYLENGLISRSGWAIVDDSPSASRSYLGGWGYNVNDPVQEDGSRSLAFEGDADGIEWAAERADAGAMDIYFMGYGHDYKQALTDFTKLSGSVPLPPDYVFGYWYSRYAPYSADDYRGIMNALASLNIPADVLILDMDWHWNGKEEQSNGRGGWTGWTWNTKLIPDPEGLLRDIHGNNLKVALNLHPADGVAPDEDFYNEMCADMGMDPADGKPIAWDLENKDFYRTFFSHIIRERERQGVDFWWLDWQQNPVNKHMSGLGETFWCNHVFYNDMKNNRPDRRPVIFHRWGGLGSHRYQIGFSGDTYINFPTLAFQPYFTATASNQCYPYWGHDLGGHLVDNVETVNDPELVLRWFQFGAFSPIFRSHACEQDVIERRIWKFDNFDDLNATVHLRYRLFPYIYTMARETYETGIGICRPLYYEYPEVEEAYNHVDQYFFGNDILVAPITEAATEGNLSAKTIWFPEGSWYDVSHGTVIEGPCTKTIEYTCQQIPYFYRNGSIIPLNPATVTRVSERPVAMTLDIVAGADGESSLYEDLGDNGNYETQYARTSFVHAVDNNSESFTIGARQGDSQGLPTHHEWTMRVVNAQQPQSVSIDGNDISTWAYDAMRHELTIMTDSRNCSKPTKVDVKYAAK